ncbi:hypothetical protein ACLKA6_009586 [Drosophila palustris]
MLRLFLLPLFLFTLSMVCMGQTFQYSRGWTNGKRAPPATVVTNGHNLGLLDLYDIQDTPNDRRLERCLTHLQHFVGNPILRRSLFANGLAYDGNRPDSEPEVRNVNIRSRANANRTIMITICMETPIVINQANSTTHSMRLWQPQL